VLAVLAGGCGEPEGPGVSVAWEPVVTVIGTASATLTPQGAPGGVIALKLVRDGRVRTLARHRFQRLTAPGTARLEVGGRSIGVTWTLPGGGSGADGAEVLAPRGSKAFAAATSGRLFEPDEFDGEWVLWAQERCTGPQPSSDSLPMGTLSSVVTGSRRQPRVTVYCLTLEVEAQ